MRAGALPTMARTNLDRSHLAASWRSHRSFDARLGPKWLHVVWTTVFAMGMAAAFTVLGFALYGSGEDAWLDWAGWAGWGKWHGMNLVVALCVGFAIHGLCRLGDTHAVVGSLLLALLINFAAYQLFAARARQVMAEKQAAEARLRLLQGQIEPHFLFNTLANVVALIDHDAAKAKRMLETFTDDLRSSLASLRREDSTLGSELDLVQTYLDLLKARMEDRLQFSIEGAPRCAMPVCRRCCCSRWWRTPFTMGSNPSSTVAT